MARKANSYKGLAIGLASSVQSFGPHPLTVHYSQLIVSTSHLA